MKKFQILVFSCSNTAEPENVFEYNQYVDTNLYTPNNSKNQKLVPNAGSFTNYSFEQL